MFNGGSDKSKRHFEIIFIKIIYLYLFFVLNLSLLGLINRLVLSDEDFIPQLLSVVQENSEACVPKILFFLY